MKTSQVLILLSIALIILGLALSQHWITLIHGLIL